MKKIFILILAAATLGSCNYLDVEPIGQVIPHTLGDYRALLTTAYEQYPSHKTRLSWATDEVGDIFLSNGSYMVSILNTTWRFENTNAQQYDYATFYKTIFIANEVIDKTPTAEKDGLAENREQILAEAYALRAYSYFDLLNLYAKWYDPATAATDKGVPVTTIIDIQQKFPRATIEKTYERILADIESAKEFMQVAVQPTIDKSTLKYRFSKRSIKALEARVRLYRGEFDQAYTLATELLSEVNDSDFKLVDLVADKMAKPYSALGTEAILSLEKVFQLNSFDLDETFVSDSYVALYKAGDNRYNKSLSTSAADSWGYVHGYEAMYGSVYIPDFDMDMPYFLETNRSRKQGDRISIRLSEIYLIAAEAAVKKSAPSEADARTFLGELQAKRITTPPDLSLLSGDALQSEIMDERARELISEGHRWFDLRRTTRPLLSKDIIISSSYNTETFEAVFNKQTYRMSSQNQYILPFPRSAVDNNPELNSF